MILSPSAALLAAVDGVNILSVTGVAGAVWVRAVALALPPAYEAAWYVSTTGSDAAAGTTVGAPLKTLKELARRLNGARIAQNTTVTLGAGTFQEDPVFSLDMSLGFFFTIVGNVTSSAVDTLAAYTPNTVGAAGTNVGAVRALFTATTATLTDKSRLRMTSGAAAGCIAYVTRVVTPGVGTVVNVWRFAQLATVGLSERVTLADPSAGDTYVTDTLNTTVGAVSFNLSGGQGSNNGFATLQDCNVTSDGIVRCTPTWWTWNTSSGVICIGPYYYRCTFTPVAANGHFVQFQGYQVLACCQVGGIPAASTTCALTGGTTLTQCNVWTIPLVVSGNAVLSAVNSTCFDVDAANGGAILAVTSGVFDYCSNTDGNAVNDVAWFDGADGNGVQVEGPGSVHGHGANCQMWGLNNAYTGVFAKIFGRGLMLYDVKPSVPGGTGNDASVGGNGKLWAAIPFAAAVGSVGEAAAAITTN